MTQAQTLLALASKVEAATGPNAPPKTLSIHARRRASVNGLSRLETGSRFDGRVTATLPGQQRRASLSEVLPAFAAADLADGDRMNAMISRHSRRPASIRPDRTDRSLGQLGIVTLLADHHGSVLHHVGAILPTRPPLKVPRIYAAPVVANHGPMTGIKSRRGRDAVTKRQRNPMRRLLPAFPFHDAIALAFRAKRPVDALVGFGLGSGLYEVTWSHDFLLGGRRQSVAKCPVDHARKPTGFRLFSQGNRS